MSEGSNVFWDVVEEHLDDAEFLFTQWERGLVSASYTLTEVAEREEERLLANVDGLVAGGAPVRLRVSIPALASDAHGRRAAAALAILEAGDPAAADPVLRALREGEPPIRASVERALGLAPAPWIDDALRSVLHDAPPAVQAAALGALAFRRASPGAALSGLRAGDDPALLAAAFRSAAGFREKVPLGLVLDGLSSAFPVARDEALTAGLSLGLTEAWAACQKLARGAGDETFASTEPLPLLFAATLGDVRDVEPLVHATSAPRLRRAAVWALGYSGRVSAAETCLALLGDPDLGRLAGEAFAAVTGLPAATRFLAPEAAESDEPVPLEADDLGKDLVPTAEDALPLLDPAAVEAWWGEQRSRFERARRYLYGVPWGRESVHSLLAHGPMRRRRGVAAEVAARTRGRIQVETRALSDRQRAEVASAAALQAGELERAFG